MDDAHNLWKRASNLRKRIPEVRVSTRITQTCIAAKAPRSCPLWVIFVRSARSRHSGDVLLRPESGHWELSTLARSSRGPPISHWDGFLASLRLGPHACDCCTLESALGLTECERSVKWL